MHFYQNYLAIFKQILQTNLPIAQLLRWGNQKFWASFLCKAKGSLNIIKDINRLLTEMDSPPIQEHKYRFVIFITYVLAALVNSLPVNTFAALNSTVQNLFDLSIVEVSLNTLMYPIAHTVFALPCNWLLNKKGIRVSFYLAAFLVIAGMWLRTFLTVGNSYICLLGSLLSAIGGIFILNTPSRLAINWFKSQTVPYVTFVGVLVNLVSMAVGLTIPGMFVRPSSTSTDVINFLRLEAIITTVPFIFLVIFIREKPEHPPSKAALAFNTTKRQGYGNIMKAIFSNKEYLKLSISMSLNYGICIGFLAVIEQVMVGLGYNNSSRAISVCGTSGILFGLVSNVLYSTILKKSKQYKRVLTAAAMGDFVGGLCWAVGLAYVCEEWWQLVIISGMFCFNHLSLPSIYVLYSTELAFPIDQSSAAGYMIAISQTVGFLSGLLFANILNGTKEMAYVIFFVTGACLFISILVSLSIKQDLRKTRFQAEKDREESAQNMGKESLLTSS